MKLLLAVIAVFAIQASSLDVQSRRDWSQDRLGRRTTYQYDAAGRLRFTIQPDATPADLTDNPRTETVYDLVGVGRGQGEYCGFWRTLPAFTGDRSTILAPTPLCRPPIMPPPAFGGTIAYTLDKVGNRLARNSSVSPVPSAVNSFDSNDRLTSDTYDTNGNTISALSPSPLNPSSSVNDIYDFENRLIRRTTTRDSQSLAIDSGYDCDGNRISETVTAGGGSPNTVTFLVDTQNPTGYAQVVEERVNGVLSRTYAHGHALLSQTQATLSGWTTSYFIADGHGSIRQLTDALGTVTDTYKGAKGVRARNVDFDLPRSHLTMIDRWHGEEAQSAIRGGALPCGEPR